MKELFLLGDSTLKVTTEERYRRTVVTSIPDEIRNIKDETWIPECIRIFSSDWTVVQNHEEDRGRYAHVLIAYVRRLCTDWPICLKSND